MESGGNPLQDAPEEETQSRDLIDHRADGQLSFVHQVSLILPDVIRAQSIRRFTEVSRETLDGAEVTACSSFREVTSLEFLQHYFAKTGHRDLLVTRNYLATTSTKKHSGTRTRSVRRASGFVLVGDSYKVKPNYRESGDYSLTDQRDLNEA